MSKDIKCKFKAKKPRSKLQQVTTQANHLVYFRLQPIGMHSMRKLVSSDDTRVYLELYSDALDNLVASIKRDSDITKQLIRHYDKKKLDSKP